MFDSARVLWRVLRAEGGRAVVERSLDRLAERVASARRERDGKAEPVAPVLNVLGTAPARRLGGLPTQLVARLGEERRHRPVSLLYPHRADGGLASAVRAAAARTRARAVHLEGLGGVPPTELAELASLPVPLVVSVHDFAGWCVSAHLLETPARRFCGFSSDAGRCARCLASAGLTDALDARRAAAERVLRASIATIFPSAYLRDRHAALFPGVGHGHTLVIAPASTARAPRVARAALPGAPPAITFVGSVSPLKGGHLIEPATRELRRRHPALAVHVLGGGDASLLLALRRVPGVTVHGYYRAGTLPERLAALGASVAVAPSIVPEAFHLTLSECWLAGVPCVAFDHGASAERIRAHGGGHLVPLESGAHGVADGVDALFADASARDVRRAAASVPTPAAAAAAHLALYAALGLTP